MENTARKQLLDGLRRAFPLKEFDDEWMLRNRCWGYDETPAFEAELRGNNWPSLSRDCLEKHKEVLFSLPPEGFIDLLPAFLHASIEGFEQKAHFADFVLRLLNRDPSLPASLEAFEKRVSRLTPLQIQATRLSLEYLEELFDKSWTDNPAREALDSYWRKLESV